MKKAAAKKTTNTKAQKEKLEQYNSFSLGTCIEMANAMGMGLYYDQIEEMLMDEADTKKLANSIIKEFKIDEKDFTFDKDGYDADLIQVIVDRIADNALVKASDFKNIGAEIRKHQKYAIKDDSTANNEEYNVQFDLVRRVLMMAQRKDIHATVDMKKLIGENPEKLIVKFMDLAYKILGLWKYDDVKYYENFIYAVLSQFEDL
ncbi:MAG: neurofilament protein, partial [Erysipelotrichaceae bacterium]|nr:neurofilament protein [Erysipelotrichaceae bacterium]